MTGGVSCLESIKNVSSSPRATVQYIRRNRITESQDMHLGDSSALCEMRMEEELGLGFWRLGRGMRSPY